MKNALALLVENSGALPVAGGTDLLLDLQRSGRSDSGATLIDLTSITGFGRILETEHSFLLGGGVTHNQVVADQRLRTHALPLAQACVEIGSAQLRNRATVAGNLITASPANDSISALMALGAEVVLERLDPDTDEVTRRRIPVAEFFTGFRSTQRRVDELLTEIHVPKLADNERGIWVKLGLRKAQAISVVHGGLIIGLDGDFGDMTVTSARLALGSVAPTVVIVDEFEHALVGQPLTDELIIEAGRVAATSVAPIDDGRATAEYRTNTIATLVERSLRALRSDAQADGWMANPPLLGSGRGPSPATASLPQELSDQPITITVNSNKTSAVGATATLLDWLRDQSLSGVKEGCAEGECGACTVELNGDAVMSCLVAAGQADGATVVTIEGLASPDGQLHPLQENFVADFAVQCGYCIPGFLMAGASLLRENPAPSDDQIRLGLSGNLCRCTGYYPIIEAIRSTARDEVAQ